MYTFVAVIFSAVTLLISLPVQAATTTASFTATGGDGVMVSVSGTPNSSIQLSFLPAGASSLTTIAFGTTNASGTYTTTISSGGYGIPAGSAAYVSVNGLPSQTMLWPTYTSTMTLSQSSVQVAVGQTATVNASSAGTITVSALQSVASASMNGSQITITGSSTGSGMLTVCASSLGCATLSVVVGGTGQTQITFSKNNFSMQSGDSTSVTIFGGGTNGYIVKSNSNAAALWINLAPNSSVIPLFANPVAGVATVTVCSVADATNCTDLVVTVTNITTNGLTFSQNNLSLTPGVSQSVTLSGGPNSNYFVSSNSNTAAATASLSTNTVTIVGGTTAGTAVITVCSTSVNATCGTLTVILNTTTTNVASPTLITFSQNVVSIAQNDTATVTVAGGVSANYTVSANSNPTIVTASISQNSSTLTLVGNAQGSSIITICSAAVGTTCSNVYVTIGAPISAILFNKSSIDLTPGQSTLIGLTGGATSGKTVVVDNGTIVTGNFNADQTVLVVTAGTVAGSTTITVCASQGSQNCAKLSVTVAGAGAIPITTPASTATTPSASAPVSADVLALQTGATFDVGKAQNVSPSIGTDKALVNTGGSIACQSDSLIRASGKTVYYCGQDGKRYVFPNAKTYASWFSNFSSVKMLGDDVLAQIPIGGNVTYRPGVRLLKIQTDPRVYAVAPDGTLRWITSEALAMKYYGSDWNKKVDDLPDAFFQNYRLGSDITQ